MADKPTNPTVDDLRAPLLAAVGAADLALATVNEIIGSLRERADEARADAGARVEETRDRITELQEELPKQIDELRGRLTSEELRRTAESYAEIAQQTYNGLVERGEAALERIKSSPQLEETATRAEGALDRGVELTQEALGTVAAQTRAVGERAAKLVGVELPKKTDDPSVTDAADTASAKISEATDAASDKVSDVADTASDKVSGAAEAVKSELPAKKAPAKKAPAKKAPASGATPARKAPAKRVTQK